MSAIHDAIDQGDLEKVTALFREDPSILEAEGGYGLDDHPLHVAAASGQVEIAEFQLAEGADVNARGDMQRTPLHYAAKESQPRVAAVLVKHGCDLSPVDAHGFTPLLYAVQGGGPDGGETATVLLDLGVPLDLNAAVWLLDLDESSSPSPVLAPPSGCGRVRGTGRNRCCTVSGIWRNRSERSVTVPFLAPASGGGQMVS
jgi:ankyrin repeat protein